MCIRDSTYKYQIYAIDAEGTRHDLPSGTEFTPASYHVDYASIFDNGYVAEGFLVGFLSWTMGIAICPDSCWEPLAFIYNPPAEFTDLVNTSTTVQISGQIGANYEGAYISEVTSWSIIPGCSVVPAVETNWGGLKALYR